MHSVAQPRHMCSRSLVQTQSPSVLARSGIGHRMRPADPNDEEFEGMTCDHPRIWIDTTTLHRTFRHGPARVTGIPRVVCECIREARLDKVLRDRIRFCCASEANWSISEISFEDVDRLIALTEADLVYK